LDEQENTLKRKAIALKDYFADLIYETSAYTALVQ
jgi:hypothetical protein